MLTQSSKKVPYHKDLIFNKMKINRIVFILILLLSKAGILIAQSTTQVNIVGAMRNVMWKGQLSGTIQLDTISVRQHLYGLGPVENLAGEILILDGKCYRSTVISKEAMQVEETFAIKAPFFGYAHIPEWAEQLLPDSIQTISQLEQYLDRITQSAPRPFMFKLSGNVESAVIHIVNLPKGTKVSSPEEAHQGKTSYAIESEPCDILGFFSTEHKAVFTHHDTFLHLHLITADRKKMGHLDDLTLQKGAVRLFLPKG
jgi:acetolactate decarboxylase